MRKHKPFVPMVNYTDMMALAINAFCKKYNYTPEKLSRVAGISPNHISFSNVHLKYAGESKMARSAWESIKDVIGKFE